MSGLRTIASVIRGEGGRSALRRAQERAIEAGRDAALLFRGRFATTAPVDVLIVAAAGAAPRLGGVQAQLNARLLSVPNAALLRPGLLELPLPVKHARRVSGDLEAAIHEGLAMSNATAVELEGMSGIPIEIVLRLARSGVAVRLRLHDFSLFCPRPHLLEEPASTFCGYSTDLQRCARCLRHDGSEAHDQARHRELAREVLQLADAIVVPSQFLLGAHRRLFGLPDLRAKIEEPFVAARPEISPAGPRSGVAFAGMVKRHKGAHLLPVIARRLPNVDIHVFGGGDVEIFDELRRHRNLKIHGYYRMGSLPRLLARHGIGLVLMPSIVPEAYGLVLSEAWDSGASVASFDLGAQADRIRQRGRGFIVPLERGAEGMVTVIEEWSGRRKSGSDAIT
jgi:hypothetical protein